jgi:lipopolysaccharide biosynthesis glycosyltransferase
MKTIVAIIVYNRFENIERWINCWKKCDQADAELVIIQSVDRISPTPTEKLCADNGIKYFPRLNKGLDIGAFAEVCQGKIKKFPEFDRLLWITDDVIPMRKDFVKWFTGGNGLNCMEISNKNAPLHVRTTGFSITKDIANRLVFGKLETKMDCYDFEHRSKDTLMLQVQRMGLMVEQVEGLHTSPLWDTDNRRYLKRWNEHNQIFTNDMPKSNKILITTVFDRNYKEAGKTLFNTIKRYTDCTNIDFKIITADLEVIKEFGATNCHFVNDEIKARYSNVKYSVDLPENKYATSWYRYEMFNMVGYDRVLCIDCDCICIEDISYLFSDELNDFDLISVEDHIVSKCFMAHVPALERQGLRFDKLMKRMKEGKIDVQPALLVANKSIVNKDFYNRLINYANTAPFSYSIDEGVLNDFIYMEGLKIKLLPLEWDYQDCYEIHCPSLPIPKNPIIVHCQESKPFKKTKNQIDKRMHKWHDRWKEESKPILPKTIVAIIVWNRFENLKIWLNCWNQCDKAGGELVVVHNLEQDNERYSKLCADYNVKYVPRENKGFDIGAFQDVCKERLKGFPNKWENLIWITDDCIPMAKDFVGQYLAQLQAGNLPCYEISDVVKRHIRTTGFTVTKKIATALKFPKEPIENREDCYDFEHKSKTALYEQVIAMGYKPVMINTDLKQSALWDEGVRGHLNLKGKHEQVFPPLPKGITQLNNNSLLDRIAIKHKSDKSSRFHNYAVKYDRILSSYRETFTSILEIGVAQGQSVSMWADYFVKATIHGADISQASESCVDYSKRIKFHLLDQRNLAQLKNMEQFSPFDLIIDDGNHYWMEQVLTFETLFNYLKSGGIYIVEDTTTSYWNEYRNSKISPVEYFKKFADYVHLSGQRGKTPSNPPSEFKDWEKGWHRREDCHVNVPLFDSVQFYNGFIVITKA